MGKSLVVDPPPPAPPDDRPRRRRSDPPPPGGGGHQSRWKTALAYALGVLLIVVGLVFGGVAYRVLHDHLPPPTTFSEILIPPPASVFGKERIYVMLLGTDFNRDEKGMPYSKGARSDTIMVLGIDFPSKSMKLISVLRDTEAIVNGRDEKINQAYSDGGVKLADQVLGEFAGLPKNERGTSFDRYIVVNANGLKDFVNAIGGIEVPVTETMDYDDSWGQLHIHFKPGLQHMDGQKAMEYSRFRHDACSDLCRTQRQQQIIHITMAKLKSQKLNSLVHIVPLIGAINKNVKTNLTFNEEQSLAWAFRNANVADLSKAETLKYVDTKETTYGGEVAIPDAAQKAKLFAELVGPYGNVTPPPATALQAVKPASVHVVVQNGSGVSGLATSVSEKLTKLGYVVDSVGNADTFGYDTTQIRPATRVPNVGERVRADLGVPAATVAPATDATPGPRTVVTVIVGRDYATASATAAPTSSVAPARR
ncbi:MAG: polyisoprenyl-teichoic acid--peptidoglycan teichoic acid transferase [Candidatus Eremiobacteraeota bacterium]|jgi:LCP family protein required for cell wall assembly|nr:polyisoprenyl-teichoic acid--peptidoglycan teichoic acid transferase [Candidatus Eremiobacteraeota bacterium]